MLERVLHVESETSLTLLSTKGRVWLLCWLGMVESVELVVSTIRVPSLLMYSMIRGVEVEGRHGRSQCRYGSPGREEAGECKVCGHSS
jgi:hypothetical protein